MGNLGRKTKKFKEYCCLPVSFVGCSSTMGRKPSETLRFSTSTLIGVIFGFLVGVSISIFYVSKINPANYIPETLQFEDVLGQNQTLTNSSKTWISSNPRGAERLPPGIVASESDLFLRRLWGEPSQDVPKKPKYLVTFTVGYDQRKNIEESIKKFSDDFTILLFHYDGRTSEWEEFEWSKRAIHVSARKQTKWWFAKRFLHPDIVAAYDYIFIWDEDLGVENFDAEKYLQLVKKHGLEISQPGLEFNTGLTWQMTRRRDGIEVHKETEEKPGWCKDPHLPPCAAFVEIMAPVFSQEAWRCVWHMIQNDLVHGWGLDFALQKCVEPAYEKIGVVDAQWIVHKRVPSLGNQGDGSPGGESAPWRGVRIRCQKEWKMFQDRLNQAEKAHEKKLLEAHQSP
ncbi:uncharacterized protein LOC141606152 isoform X1 [Silene latifolia]|uniref:uncharacterized protein LOC141606152 isoform X1 n=2 Tax=Silene latifolia TaxID=37657 RepID=UPI003D77C5EF